ncbi:blue light receptor [Rhizophlyctis rosea]|uniref:Blue light receptor n=1 Tax=Rhizophlyctis rosea TaxID=64517 RepID=A0AAD5S7G1_9FUNG|nr:blue light receptor [Rhizophlyctis rosea]
MKFGRHIEAKKKEEWAPYYIDYKALKHLLSDLEDNQSQPLPDVTNPEIPPISPDLLSPHRTLQDNFFTTLEHEIDKVEWFYLHRIDKAKGQLRELMARWYWLTHHRDRSATAPIAGGQTHPGPNNLSANLIPYGPRAPHVHDPKRDVLLSRHVSSVISHFTSSPSSHSRLLSELDDFLHVLSPSGTILYSSPATRRVLGWTDTEMKGRNVEDFLEPGDFSILQGLLKGCTEKGGDGEGFVYIRYVRKRGGVVVCEVRGRGVEGWDSHEPHQNPHSPPPYSGKVIITTAREYKSRTKSSSINADAVLELRIENVRLRRRLEGVVRERGGDVKAHPLLIRNNNAKGPVVEVDEEEVDEGEEG